MTGVMLAMALVATTEARLDVIDKVNQHRAARGTYALEVDDGLMESAQEWAERMADHQLYEHSGYPKENIAWGQQSVQDILGWWINSPGHHAQMLADHAVTGVGIAIAQNGVRC